MRPKEQANQAYIIKQKHINSRSFVNMVTADKVRQIIVEKLGVRPEQVQDSASFIEDLGADSLDIVELVMELEDRFEIKIPDDQVESMTTVGDAIKFIESKASAE